MEKLLEKDVRIILESIAKLLSPADLARCSAVSHKWREIFNQDWIWRPHCDPELEEPLESIPCITTTPFPKLDRLPPICRWRMAFLREKHLWKNWKHWSDMFVDEIIPSSPGYEEGVEFLMDTLIIVYNCNTIEIVDVSVSPPVLVAKTLVKPDMKESCSRYFKIRGLSSNAKEPEEEEKTHSPTLLEIRSNSVGIYTVDTLNKSISFKKHLKLANWVIGHCMTGDYYIGLSDSTLVVYDLNTDQTVKVERLPLESHYPVLHHELTSGSNEFVALCFELVSSEDHNGHYYKYFFYSLDQLIFLPQPVIESKLYNKILLLQCYAALYGPQGLTVHDLTNGDVLITKSRSGHDIGPFVFRDTAFIIHYHENEESKIAMFIPSSRILTVLHQSCQLGKYRAIELGNKFIGILCVSWNNFHLDTVWEVSNEKLRRLEVDTEYLNRCVTPRVKINQSFTKVIYGEVIHRNSSHKDNCPAGKYRGCTLFRDPFDLRYMPQCLCPRGHFDPKLKWFVKNFW